MYMKIRNLLYHMVFQVERRNNTASSDTESCSSGDEAQSDRDATQPDMSTCVDIVIVLLFPENYLLFTELNS